MILYLLNDTEVKKNSSLIPKIKRLYHLCFPDFNEREKFNHIIRRVKGLNKEFDPNTILVLYKLENEIAAGMVADWYPQCQCIHLTYLFVHPEYRNNGLARRFLTEEVSNLIDKIYIMNNIKIKAVFLESNIPSKTPMDSFSPDLRLKIFKRIGIKWIDIPYVQPALDNNKAKVNNLYLLTLPLFKSNSKELNIDYIINFLKSLYNSLRIKIPEQDLDYQVMINSLNQQKNMNNCIKLKLINVS
jgi:hypothetical protein